MVIEVPSEEMEPQPEDEDGAQQEENEVEVSAALDDLLQNELEILVSVLQELEESGDVDQETLDSLEEGLERAAESLITMREAGSVSIGIPSARRSITTTSSPFKQLTGRHDAEASSSIQSKFKQAGRSPSMLIVLGAAKAIKPTFGIFAGRQGCL